MTKQRLAPDMFRQVVEDGPGLIICDRRGEIIFVNSAIECLFGYQRDGLNGQSINALLPGCLARGSTQVPSGLRHHVGIRRDKSEFSAEVHFNATTSSAESLLLAVVLDITDRRNSERLKDEFVSTVSHELRTPLTSIAGSLGLLAGGAAGAMPESAMRLLKIAHKNSERLVRLINDILDIQKIESGKLVLDLKRIELPALIEQAIEANRGYAQSFGVRVVLEPVGEPVHVHADADRLVQAVTNLLSNACKHSLPDGEVTVSIDTARDGVVRTSVRDHGAGIPGDFRPRIFEKFAQADADARQKGGTGLGLSIVKQIVTLLGGSVGFQDAEGGGTVFHIDLPRWDAVNGAMIQRADSEPILIRDQAIATGTIAPVPDGPLPL